MAVTKILLVGEVNPYGRDPRAALWPAPINSAGWRLCHKVLNLAPSVYLRTFNRMNLCTDVWHLDAAREKAQEILAGREGPLVLLGAKVCRAFGYPFEPFTVQTSLLGPEKEVATLPHPSGRCFAWNTLDSAEKAQELIRNMRDRLEARR